MIGLASRLVFVGTGPLGQVPLARGEGFFGSRYRRNLKLVLYFVKAYSKLFLEAIGPRVPAHYLVPHA